MQFYPDDMTPPDRLVNADFLLRPLSTGDVALDYEAVMESAALLQRWGGSSWPAAGFTLEGNLADLARHEQEHESGLAFTYTVMNLSESECLGCVYVNSLIALIRAAGLDKAIPISGDGRQAVVRFWVRQSRLSEDLDWRLLQALIAWFKSQWAFQQLYFGANDRDERQKAMLRKAGLTRIFTLEVPGRVGPFLAYGSTELSGLGEAL